MSVLVMHQNDRRPMDTIKVVNPKTGNTPMLINEIDFTAEKYVRWEDFVAEVERLVQADVDAKNAEIESAKTEATKNAQVSKKSAKDTPKESVEAAVVNPEAVTQEKDDAIVPKS